MRILLADSVDNLVLWAQSDAGQLADVAGVGCAEEHVLAPVLGR